MHAAAIRYQSQHSQNTCACSLSKLVTTGTNASLRSPARKRYKRKIAVRFTPHLTALHHSRVICIDWCWAKLARGTVDGEQRRGSWLAG